MKALLVARKSLLEAARELTLLGLVVLTPLVFVGITAFAYNAPLLATHPVLVMNESSQGASLIKELQAQRYADGRAVFDVTLTTDREGAEAALKEQRATMLVTIPEGDAAITVRGDALYGRFYRASILLESVVARYADRVAGRPEIVKIVEEPLSGASPQTELDVYMPGMVIFALLLIVPQTAMLVAREIRWGTLRRLSLTRLKAWELLGGVTIAQMVVAVFQVVIVLVTALAVGFHNRGSLLLAIVVGLAISFSAIGLGLIVACFVENDGQAINVGSTVSMVQVFFSGALYQLPPMTVLTLAGHPIDLFDVFPAAHGFLALQQVLSYGGGLRKIGFRLGATLTLSALYFVVGVVVFQRRQMQEGNR